MAEKRADRLNVDAQLQQPHGETVPKRMKMNVGKPERLYLPLEAALKGAGIRRASGPAEQVRFGTVCGKKGFFQKRKQKFRNRQNPMRTPGFGRADCKPRARARAACAPPVRRAVRCTVLRTAIVRFSQSISDHFSAHTSPSRMPV